ncbi:hypothetical protein ASPZODRAFT_109194 [Penicilliopsis zonata CBS 506.65]|uniref:Nitrogen permease regulator 3 n=1 Tax=Penicilliopsis zonata CBS 506.65 TaxID=1073090 RepID=A0A1L9SR93_9EURO|nr:hypothetical protein ASPZODRAFT_109194 [Penicilliopsis zonata CBS 506.65]OJJ49627.1 hypothetical protein ASPZODRAFT_109194 [Penicilliopsis zonata CBS 506.65]
MSSIARPPDPCLVAILLIVRSRAGPRLVFHYPPNPLNENGVKPTPASASATKGRRSSRSKATPGGRSTESSSSSDSGVSSDEDDEEVHSYLANSAVSGRRGSTFGLVGGGGGGGGGGADDTIAASASSVGGDSQRPGSLGSGRASAKRRDRGGVSEDAEDEQIGSGGGGGNSDRPESASQGINAGPSWGTFLGLPAVIWEKLLSPTRAWHKRRFEVGVNDLAFIGWPVFVRDDGTWRKQRRKKKKPRADWEGGELGHNENAADTQGEEGGGDLGLESTTDKQVTPSSGSSTTQTGNTNDGREDSPDTDKDSMTMFNVVFVLDPPLLEYSLRIREIYDNIIKKFSKALKWEQARTNYIWRESQRISMIKEKAKELQVPANNLYSELLSQSSLARAISIVFNSISASKIASVPLNQQVSISLQIPPLTSTAYLPGPTDISYPGLWLTTADSVTPSDDMAGGENEAAPHQVLAKHFALLLLDNEATILKDIEASGGALAPTLAHYIRHSKPTKSFAQISVSSGISLSTIQMLASHLVYWRRARAIPPIHQRDTYIVSPNCDLSKLDVATVAYAQAFPTLPSLPKMLAALSGTPRPYGNFIPSKDHKETYFAIVAWLLRGGWITQLRAFARVKVPPEIKMAVERAVRKEEIDRYLLQSKNPSSMSGEDGTSDEENENGDISTPDDDYDETASSPSSSSSSSLASHGSGDMTPIPLPPITEESLYLSHSILDQTIRLNISSLIPYPHRASAVESRWLDEIMMRFPEAPAEPNQHHRRGSDVSPGSKVLITDGSKTDALNRADLYVRKYWPIFLKYFNGSDAFEKIPVRENLKRKLVWHLLMRLGLVTGQQSSLDLDPREQVLVSFRHW